MISGQTLIAIFAVTFLLAEACVAFESVGIDRRSCLAGIVAGVCLASPDHANAVISSKQCVSGQGEGCEDLAEGSEFIKSLQKKSAANADQYAKEARDAYFMKNYPDFFDVVGKTMVKKSDGSFFLVDDLELQKLKDDNKIGVEIPRAMGGRVTDLTQKPVLVLKE